MTEVVTEYNIFWLIIFSFLTIIVITTGIVIIKSKDNNLFGNIFYKHTDEHINTTDKFSKAHSELIALPKQYEEELHSLEKSIKETNDRLLELTIDINNKIDLLVTRIIKLEKK